MAASISWKFSTRSCAEASASFCATAFSGVTDSVVSASWKAPRRDDSERSSAGWPITPV